MKKSVYLEYEEIGPVLFRKNRRAKHLRIAIRPNQEVVVTVPFGVRLSAAQEFVQQKKDWIIEHVKKAHAAARENPIYDAKTPLKSRSHEFDIRPHAKEEFTSSVLRGTRTVALRYPRRFDIRDEEVQDFIREALIWVFRSEAKEILPQRVAELAEKHGFPYRKLFIKRHKSRWGSCSEVNNINLNLHLMRLPDGLINYVILHELVHTVIKNHSKAFWKKVLEVCPDAKMLRKQLRNHALF